MDIPKFKDIIQKVSFLRNYSSLMLPVFIMLAGLLLFIPTNLMSSKLKKRIENESVSIGKRVKSFSNNVVSRDQWKIEQEYQHAYETDANQIALLAKQTTQRELLSYKVFPEPKDTSTLIFREFGQRYRSGIDELINRTDALDCPTAAELQRGLKGSGSLTSRQIMGLIGSGLNEVDATITDVLCREKAESARVYANPADMAGYEFWKEYNYVGMKTAIEDCWYWQLSYWIIEDVFKTIEASNFGSSNVFTSPVKRLMSVNFFGRGMTKNTAARPRYVISPEGGAMTRPYTGRFCDEDIDVVHFNVVVLVNAKAVLPFMQQLCSVKQHMFKGFFSREPERSFKHNQITILESSIRSIDRNDETHSLYRYGEDAVVELDLICEYIFNKSGYDEIKPKSVKETLGDKQKN